MKESFNSKQEANEYKEKKHQLFGRVLEPIEGTGKWALNFPLKSHVTVHQPHAPVVSLDGEGGTAPDASRPLMH